MRMAYLTRLTFCILFILGLCFTLHIPISISFAESPPLQIEKPQPILVRIGTVLPAGVSFMKYLMEYAEALRGHHVEVELQPGGILGDGPAMIKMVQEGKLDGTFVINISLEEVVPEALVLTLPFLFRDEYEAEFIIEKYESTFAGYARERGIEILVLAPAGCVRLFSTVPILVPNDWRGKKVMCVKGSEFSCSGPRESTVPLSISEVESALSSGEVEVVFATPAMLVVMGWYPYIRQVIMECISFGNGAFLVNPDRYQSLPEEARATMTKLIREQRKKILKQIWRDNEIAMLGLMKRGVNIIRSSPEDMEKVREYAKTSWDFGVGKWYPRKLLDDIVRDLQKYRAAKGREGSK